jgi:two-component system NtrC family response regulator
MENGVVAFAGLVGRSPAMEHLKREMAQLGPTEMWVHVFGETGTGKEMVARALHDLSPRARRPFVPFNAVGFTDDMLMGELFGHARGAFTGAVTAREGYVAKAEGGTLFVDEVAEMSPLTQARLLRFLEEKEYQRIGETTPRRADVRVISATNVDLSRRVGEGRYRRDLWHRLNIGCLVVPPLRERGRDVLLLARHFLRAQPAGAQSSTLLPPEVEEALLQYPWPGNVRELRNEMQRVALRARGREATVADLSADVRQEQAGERAGSLRAALQHREVELVRDALERHGGILARAAAELGITRQALWAKVRRLGLVGGGA